MGMSVPSVYGCHMSRFHTLHVTYHEESFPLLFPLFLGFLVHFSLFICSSVLALLVVVGRIVFLYCFKLLLFVGLQSISMITSPYVDRLIVYCNKNGIRFFQYFCVNVFFILFKRLLPLLLSN